MGDDTLTLAEFLAAERELEAAAEFPDRIDRCVAARHTGLARQHAYVCLDCTADAQRGRPVCAACSVSCHTQCRVADLGLRRFFRCACGTRCALGNAACDAPAVVPANADGRFCVCRRLILCDGSDDDTPQEDMAQCVICEDWMHVGCIATDGAGGDLVCPDCVRSHPFLEHVQCDPCVCRSSNAVVVPRAIILGEKWREALCTCSVCDAYYSAHNLSFLRLPSDDALPNAPPDPDPDAARPLEDLALSAAAKVPRADLAAGANAMRALKARLIDALEPIARAGGVVTAEDIAAVFRSLPKRRRVL